MSKFISRWHKLLSRADMDLTTLSEIDLGFYRLAQEAGIKNREFLFTHFINKEITHYTEANFPEIGLYAYQKYLNSKEKFSKQYQRGLAILKNTKKLAKIWAKKISRENNFNNLNQALVDFYKDYNIITSFYSTLIWTGLEAWQYEFNKMLDELIKKANQEKNREKIILSIYQPWKETANSKIRKKIINCQNLQKLVDQHHFLDSFSIFWARPVKLAWFIKLKKSNQLIKVKTFSLNEIINILKPNKNEQQSLGLASRLVYLKDWRDELRREQIYDWSFLFTALAKRFKVKKDDLGYLTLAEIKEFLISGSLDLNLIKLRKAGCIVTVDKNNKVCVLLNDHISKYRKIMAKSNSNLDQENIPGLIAFKGKVNGKVRIVRNILDIKNFRSGEILVANTTHPDYVPAMKMAIAFITNEGGIISHTAIIAREMKKPCLVGTKIATKVLHDGDLVEVDADKGIVKIIKKAKVV